MFFTVTSEMSPEDLNQLMYDWYGQTGQIRPAKTFEHSTELTDEHTAQNGDKSKG